MPINQSVSAELINYFNLEKVSGTERNKIIAICNDMVDNAQFFNEVHNSIVNVAEGKHFKIETHLPALISAILGVMKSVQYYKNVNEERMPSVIYCVLISALYEFYPKSLEEIPVELLRTLFANSIELVLLVPQTVKIAKQSCISCIASKIKALNKLNKGKILI
jgi:hypothetical protein